MMDAETQLIEYSPSHIGGGGSSDSEESSGSDSPSNQPTQLLYTQLLDSYNRYGENVDDPDRTQQLDAMEMATQLIDGHSFDDFRDHKGIGDDCTMIIPSEDEASKDTQLVNADNADSGASSGKDDEVDSALSPFGAAFKDKTSHWLAELACKRKPGNGSAFISGEDPGGRTQDVFSSINHGMRTDLSRDYMKFGSGGAGVGNSTALQSRDSGIPLGLRDSDHNKQNSVAHRMVGSWQEVVGQRNGCNEDDRVWESAVGGLQIVDSDASTEDEGEGEEKEEDNGRDLNTGSTFGQLSQINGGRLSAYSSGNFCQQDLNKSPEPETLLMDDDWGGVNVEDLGIIGRIDEGGSNVGILDRHELACPSQTTPIDTRNIGNVQTPEATSIDSRNSEGIQTGEPRSFSKVISYSRTSGSIRTASLRASALRVSSCSSSARYRHTPHGSQSEEVHELERNTVDEQRTDVPWETAKTAGFNTPTSRLSIQKGVLSSAASVASVWSNTEKRGENSGSAGRTDVSEKASDQNKGDLSVDNRGSSRLGLESTRTGDKNLNTVRKLFLGDEVQGDRVLRLVKDENVERPPAPLNEDGGTKKIPDSPTIVDSQADKRLERRGSFGSGVFSGGSELSYLNFQSPGEDSQARALNMVDKLVWLNAIGLPQELQLEEEKVPARGPSTVKNALQSRVQVAEAKAGMNDPLGVFDWVDSQHDEAGIFFGNNKANTLKGPAKSVVATGHPKQVGFGVKKVQDAFGLRNKKMEKAPERPLKPVMNSDRLKGAMMQKHSFAVKDNKIEQQGRLARDLTCTAVVGNLQDPGRVQTVHRVDAPRHPIGYKGLHDIRGSKDAEGTTSTAALDKSLLEVISNVAQYRNTDTVGDNRSKVLSKVTRVEELKERSKVPDQPLKLVDVQRGCGTSTSGKQSDDQLSTTKGKGTPVISPLPCTTAKMTLPGGTSLEGLQETVASSKNGIREEKAAVGVAEVLHIVKESDGGQQGDAGVMSVMDKPCLNSSKVLTPLQEDHNDRAVTPTGSTGVSSPNNSRSFCGIANQVDQAQDHAFDAVQPQTLETAPDKQGQSRLEPGNQDVQRFHLVVQFNDLQENDCMDCDVDASVGTPGSVTTTDHSPEREAEESVEVGSVKEIQMGPDTLGAVETMEMLRSDFLAATGEGGGGLDRHQAPSTILNSVRNDDETTGLKTQAHDGCERRRVVARRSRTQGRQITQSERKNPPGRLRTARGKAQGRRVSWAGPLEQVPTKNVEVRRGRSARHQIACREEEGATDTRESSDQEELEEANDGPTGERKRKVESLDIVDSKDSDLDKIKRRFNMSDAAVARLLGTDQDEDEDVEMNHSPGVKIRSLSHMQPEAEGDDSLAAPKIRKASKGLRSSRSRSEDGPNNGKRRRACLPFSDQDKQGGEERMSSPCETDVADTSIEGTACVETHPSDNEALPGRRRMRSIADVSSPSIKKMPPGRPPQTGFRRGRGRRLPRAPAELKAFMSDAEQTDVSPPPIPPAFPPINGRLRGKGGPRSARKRKELEPLILELSTTSPTSSKEASITSSKDTSKRRKGDAVTTSVLFSHGLAEDVGKQQRKIVAKLGGRVTTSATECTHFVAEKFVRTGNMLEAMAAGKPVVTAAWLDSCLEAKTFVDYQAYILEDRKKEEEMGFSMLSTLSEAQQRPLLQDIRVYITPGTSPGPEALARIVKAAGGQIVHEYVGPAPDGEKESEFCLVLSSEEEFDMCSPLLEQGAKVFTPELLLSGVMCHNLDFSNDQLFKNYATRRRRGSLPRRTTL